MDNRDDPPPPPPPPPPPQQLNRPSACDRHPNDQVTGFCASCLRERLEGLDTPNAARASTSSALKSIFLRAGAPPPSSSHHQNRSKSSFLRPEVRRCKSFSANRGGGPDAAFEPQRKSCDVHLRSTLWSLFHQDDRDSIAAGAADTFVLSSSSAAAAVTAAAEIGVECHNLSGFTAPRAAVDQERDEIMEAADPLVVLGNNSWEMLVEDEMKSADVRPMKDHIDLDSQAKKPPPKDLKEIAGSFWIAASLFSKKLRNWRRNHKPSKISAGGSGNACSASRPEEEKTPKPSRRFRDTHSEIAVDAFGRRSCDTAPRFSLDAGLISFDDPRCTWDEPRASWDGYLIGGSRSGPSRLPPKLDAPPSSAVQRSDGLIPVEEDSAIPGCSEQTRDYYCDSSSRRRRSLDRSSSARRLSSVELVDAKAAPNADVSPVGTTELFHWSKLDRDSKDWSSNSLREDCSESFDSALRDPPKVHSGKKPRLWSKRWSIWGFIHGRSNSRGGGPKEMERSLSEAWPELRTNGHNGGMLRSSSSTSSRRSFSNNGGLPGAHRNSLQETSGQNSNKKKKKEEELVLDKSRRHSPSHFDNGLLRFYLTPLRGSSRRNGGASARSKFSSPRSFTNSILRFY